MKIEEKALEEYPDGCDGTDRSAEVYRRVFIAGYNFAEKELEEYRKALKYFTNRVEEGSIRSKTTYEMFKNLLEKYELEI